MLVKYLSLTIGSSATTPCQAKPICLRVSPVGSESLVTEYEFNRKMFFPFLDYLIECYLRSKRNSNERKVR
jgi:hypothetical protein